MMMMVCEALSLGCSFAIACTQNVMVKYEQQAVHFWEPSLFAHSTRDFCTPLKFCSTQENCQFHL